ncbi:hypothetical protein GGU10DRAFT_340086 [Lentinula aff. detonsa]|uniref:Uncharacterized protein n=1 Tax=Lentinula aff. detonsa TaxID=2804958 RepID=A0AA38U0K4_9AGAR|nr:hypothetical protein GGU10DRAFT_340086 [Lentinula aff. detonsa]
MLAFAFSSLLIALLLIYVGAGPSVLASIMALDDSLDAHESSLAAVAAIHFETAVLLRTWQNSFYFGTRSKLPAEKEKAQLIRVRFREHIPSLNRDLRKLLGYGSGDLLGSNFIDECLEGFTFILFSVFLYPVSGGGDLNIASRTLGGSPDNSICDSS